MLAQVLQRVRDPTAITALEPPADAPHIVYGNPAFLQLHRAGGLLAEDPVSLSLIESHRHEGVYSTDLRCSDPDGSRRVLRLQSEPVTDGASATPHRIAIFHDVTAETNLGDALRRNERLACVGLLGAGIAHELNNPIGSALVAAETALSLSDTPGAAEQLGACLRNVVASMDRCGRIVRTLLRYTREEPTERQACSLNDVVEQAVELARPYVESRSGTRVRTELEPTVPLAPMNPLEIELVLINLIRNAVEARRDEVTISIQTKYGDGLVRAIVSDDGCGMNEEQLAHAFDPLYTTRRQAGGSGLGMGIAQGIVRAHNGQIRIESRLGAGTIVTVELPLA
ncbi:MAG: ATP-binding protein [Thermoguttaceae bacterium]